jgi:transketolase
MNYEDTLVELAAKDEALVVLTAENRAAIRGLPERLGARFVDVGICEQTMIGAAAGLALRGRIPICHSLATFLTLRAFEFIRTDVGIAKLPVKLIGGVPGFLSEANGPTHQAVEDVALMRTIPNMSVVCPADEDELVQALPAIVAHPGPVYVRYNASPAAVSHAGGFALGKAEIVSRPVPADVALFTYGFLLREARKAAAILEAAGVRVALVNMRSLKPVDEGALVSAALEARLVVTIEDHFLSGGLYTILAEVLLKHGVVAKVVPLALEERWFKPALLADVLEHEGFTGEKIAARVVSLLQGALPCRTASE